MTVTPTVSEDNATVTVTVDNGASVTSSGSDHTVRNLDVGSNEIHVVVTAQDGTTQTYTVTVTRAESSDATLSDLAVSDGDLFPEFDPSESSYDVDVGNLVEDVTVTPTVTHDDATVTVNETPVTTSGSNHTVEPGRGFQRDSRGGDGPGRHDPDLYGDGDPGGVLGCDAERSGHQPGQFPVDPGSTRTSSSYTADGWATRSCGHR